MSCCLFVVQVVCCILLGVKIVRVVLYRLGMRLFVLIHVCISCRYDWMFDFAMFMSLCVDVMVMSSA